MNDKVAFLVPTTSRNRDWADIDDSYLNQILLSSVSQHCPRVDITFFIGFDTDDEIFSQITSQKKIEERFPLFHICWVPIEPDQGNVVGVWNQLAGTAIFHEFNYLMVLGDDIFSPKDNGWLGHFIRQLKKQQNVGWCAGYSNNTSIATQFLIHKTHWDIFGFIFPPQIKNWFCDNWMNEIYPSKFKYWNKDYHLVNCGGEPRYKPNNDRKLCTMLVKRHKSNLNKHLNKLNQ